MKNIITIIFTLSIYIILGQKEGKEEKLFEKKVDNPNISFVGVAGHILSLQIDKFNMPIKFGGEGYAKIGKIFIGARALSGESLLGYIGKDKKSDIYSVYQGSGNYTNFEATAGYELASTESEKLVKVVLFKQGDTYYYVNVPTKEKSSYGIEASLHNGNLNFTSKTKKVIGKPTLPADLNKTINIGDEFAYEYMSTNYKYSVLNIGASLTKTYYVLVDSKRSGAKSASYYIRFYGRLSFLLDHQIDDVIAPGPLNNFNQPVGYYQIQLQNTTPMSKVGFNVGIHLLTPRGFGSAFFAELGVLPGPKVGALGRTYLNFGGGFALSKLFKNNL